MPYTPETFNRYNKLVQDSRDAVCRHIQYLLKPDDGYPKRSDELLKELYNTWRIDCRAMDAACERFDHLGARHEMIQMPVDDEEHFLCRRMAAVVIERYIYGEHNAQHYLPELVEKLKASECWKHPTTCACHYSKDWNYDNYELISILSAHYIEKKAAVRLASGGATGGGPLSLEPSMPPPRGALPPLSRSDEHVVDCSCRICHHKRVADGTQEAYMARLRRESDNVLAAAARADDAISAARKMPGGSTDDGFAKNLFQTVQGVKYDDKCPHGLPFYACMSCSH